MLIHIFSCCIFQFSSSFNITFLFPFLPDMILVSCNVMHPAYIPWLSVIKTISVQFYKRYAPGLLPFAFAHLFEQYNLLKLVHTKHFFSVRLFVSSLGHSFFSSTPQWPMTSDFEGFSIAYYIHYIYFSYLNS